MNKYQFPQPNERQREFFLAGERFIAYGGARGGGKSWAVRQKSMLLALNYAGIKILILRRTYPELRENHIRPLQKLLKDIAEYKETEKVFNFPNGSRIKFGYCDSEADTLQYQGQEYDIIFIDEATQFTEYQFQTLTACLRGANSFPKRIYLTCNPGGVGHNWVKRLFIDKHYKGSEDAADYRFIKAGVYDNPALLQHDKGYVKMLENLSPRLQKAWLYGDWDIFEGQFFEEFDREIHICSPFPIPPHWRIYRTMDYGLDMLAVLWIAVDEQNRAYVFRELYKPNMLISQAAEAIKSMTNEPIYATLAPPDMWNRRQETGKSVADIFAQHGILLSKSSNQRVQGWLAMKEWLKPMDTIEGERCTAALQIFPNCVNLIRCLPALQTDSKNPNDCATEPHEITHAPDALRGFCVYRTQQASRINETDRYDEEIENFLNWSRH